MNMKCRKTLKGHRGRVLHFDWSPDKKHVMTAGQVRYLASYSLLSNYDICCEFLGWICLHLGCFYWPERNCYSDHITMGAGLCLCTFNNYGGLWVREGPIFPHATNLWLPLQRAGEPVLYLQVRESSQFRRETQSYQSSQQDHRSTQQVHQQLLLLWLRSAAADLQR